MRPQRHIIKRQVLELTVPGEQGAYRLQQQLSRIYSRRLVAIIDNCCSELSDPGVSPFGPIRIDLAKALNAKQNERTSKIHFSFGGAGGGSSGGGRGAFGGSGY